jgi:integrase
VPYRRDGKWVGAISYKGRKHWVGTFATKSDWKDAEAELRTKLARQAGQEQPSTLTFSGFVVEKNWPHNYPRKRKKLMTFDTLAGNVRPFLRKFGDRTLTQSLTRSEAREWALSVPYYCHATARGLINDIIDDDLMTSNPFGRLGIPAGRGRKDIDVISEPDFEDLTQLALTIRGDEYGRVLETLVHALGEEAFRPGEAFALRWRNIDFEKNMVRIEQAVDHKGRLTLPKNGQARDIVLFPETKQRLLKMPRLSDEFVFTSSRGRMLVTTRFYYYWNPIRAAWESTRPQDHWIHARLRADTKDHFDPYELRHRAATWMCTPRPHGLGLTAVDVALQMGHTDGGALVMKLYAHPDKDLARKRILDAATSWRPPSASGADLRGDDTDVEGDHRDVA